jgi:hypothetical protein
LWVVCFGGGGLGWYGWWWGQEGEMTQALYAHMNNKRKKNRELTHIDFLCMCVFLLRIVLKIIILF